MQHFYFLFHTKVDAKDKMKFVQHSCQCIRLALLLKRLVSPTVKRGEQGQLITNICCTGLVYIIMQKNTH